MDILEKGKGEGSRGGKIIGHTKSGKPIYDIHNHSLHTEFNAEDEHDAYEKHMALMQKYREKDKKKALFHYKEGEKHSKEAWKKDPEGKFMDRYDKKNVQKALTTLEIGYLNGEVSKEVIEKARSQAGIYANTSENRKMGRVGQKYKEGEGNKSLLKDQFEKWKKERKIETVDKKGDFKVGQKVIFTNDDGIEFERNILAFRKEDNSYGGSVFLDKDSYWAPVKIDQIRSIDKKEDKFPSKEKIVEKLISAGNNEGDAKKMVYQHYDYVKRTYPDASPKKLAEVIRTIY